MIVGSVVEGGCEHYVKRSENGYPKPKVWTSLPMNEEGESPTLAAIQSQQLGFQFP